MAVIKVQVSLRLSPEVAAKLKKIAKLETRSVTNFVEHLIVKEIRRYEDVNGEIPLTEEDVSLERHPAPAHHYPRPACVLRL